MKYEEYKTKIEGGLKNIDTAPTAFTEILDSLKEDLEYLAGLENKVNEQDLRIRDLQDTNMKLFLNQTGTSADEGVEEEVSGQAAIDKFIDNLFN